ncbi:MAG TPA: hypothetical protein VNA89_04920 [Gemmatimonadaceae bacterium]|nr:hypothetical protein [Gemmatimonadaceae bacterium]
MLNPKEQQKKGGFRAFAERESERGAAQDAARTGGLRPPTDAPITDRPVLVTEEPLRTPLAAEATPATKGNGRALPTDRASRH